MISNRLKQNLRSEWNQNHLAKIGAGLVAMFFLFVVFAPILSPHDPTAQNLSDALVPPFQTMEYPLGTDQLGRDMLSRLIYGARISVLVGILSIAAATAIGTTVGMLAGYNSGRLDDVMMRITDVFITIPSLMVAVTIFGLIGPLQVEIPDPFVATGIGGSSMPESFILPGGIIFALSVTSWTTFARVARSEALSVSEENYVRASKSIGSSSPHILLRHVIPNSFSSVLVLATLRIGFAILLESSLAFLGFSGAEFSWGRDIATGRDYLASAWWVASMPGFCIVFLVLALNFLGDWLRDAVDPNLNEGAN